MNPIIKLATALSNPTTSMIMLKYGIDPALSAMSGVYIQQLIETLGEDLSNRVLSKREKTCVAACYLYVSIKINERLKKGDKLREDKFFEEEDYDYSSAEKVLEAAFISSRNEIEGKKIQYISNLLANILFTTYPFELCMFFLKIAEEMTWRQYCLTAIISRKTKIIVRQPVKSNEPKELYPIDFRICLKDLKEKQITKVIGTYKLFSEQNLEIEKFELNWIGKELFDLMELGNIPVDELIKYYFEREKYDPNTTAFVD
jgi:hypothetical protein